MSIKIRNAEYEDKEGIIELCSLIWDGEDYVPGLLEEWLLSPSLFLVAVDEENDKVVGIDHVAMNGKIAWLEGLRVHPEYRGRGISTMLFDSAMRETLKNAPLKMQSLIWNQNKISVYLSEKYSFVKTFSYHLLTKELKDDEVVIDDEITVRDIFPIDIISEIEHFQNYFNFCGRKYPDGWVIYEDVYCLGNRISVEKGDTRLICGSASHENSCFNINLIKNGGELSECLLKAGEIAAGLGKKYLQVNVPLIMPELLEIFENYGFEHMDYEEYGPTIVNLYEYLPELRDKKVFCSQMGIKNEKVDNFMGTVRRCKFGFPQVIKSFPVKNRKPFPTLFYLSCPHLIYQISKLEEKGMIESMENNDRDELYANAHELYKQIRLDMIDNSYAFSKIVDDYPAAFEKGIGGIENRQNLKCLHLQLATTLGGVKTYAGVKVLDIFKSEKIDLNCEECRCLRYL